MENFKTVEFDTNKMSDTYAEYLFGNIKDEFENIMDRDYHIGYDSIKGVNLYGDVSYSQGRGIGLDKFDLGQEDVEKFLGIKFVEEVESVYTKTKFSGNWRYKEVCLYIETTIDGGIVAKDNDGLEYTQEEAESLFEEKVKELEKRLLKYGEETMEQLEKEELCRVAFNDWKNENNIEIDYEIRDVGYTTQKELSKGKILIATSGNTNIDGLWIEPLELEQHKREVITLEDGREKYKREDIFYTLKE